jgi:hypothetical protein
MPLIASLTPCPALQPFYRPPPGRRARHIQQNNQLVRNYLLTIAQISLTDLSYRDFTKWFIRNQ